MLKSFALALGVVLVLAGPAYAQNPVNDAYGGPGNVANEVATPSQGVKGATLDVAPTGARGTLQKSRAGSLPFTGSDALLILAGGVALLAIGIGVRRLARPPV
jgi:hypothetical protein